jgi:hypothetical protein
MSTENQFIREQGGVICTRELVLKAGTLAAGVYSASVKLPAGASLMDILVNGVALWNNGTSATLIVGDASDDDGYFTAVNLKATDLLAGESLSFDLAGGKAGAYIANSQVSPRYSASERTITAQVTTVGTAPSAGETRINVIWAQPGPNSRTEHTYVAS